METLFALVLTSCVMGSNNEFSCEDFQIALTSNNEQCKILKEFEIDKIQEFDTLECKKVTYEVKQ